MIVYLCADTKGCGCYGVCVSRGLRMTTPNRPNSIGKSTVKLIEIQDNVLKVQGLDAIDGSPVLDIKPYIPGYDSVSKSKVPDWIIVDE